MCHECEDSRHRRRRRALEGLLDRGQQRLYMESAYYKTGVDNLVDLLVPVMLEGLEARAREQDERRDEELQRMMYGPAEPVTTTTDLDELLRAARRSSPPEPPTPSERS